MKSEYSLILFLTAIVPVILSNHKNIRLWRHWKALAKAVFIPSVVFWIWDIAATFRGHWNFNSKYILNLKIVNLPIEEYLFFIVLGFVSIFTYEVVKSKMADKA